MKYINSIISGITIVVVCLVMSFSVFGQNRVDLNLATRVGENFIKMNDGIALSGEVGSLQRVQTDKFPNLYIFNADGHGWIIVAGDKRMQPILGFSDEGVFDPDDMAPAAEMIIGSYDYVVDSMVRYNVRSMDESVRQAWIDLEKGCYREESGNMEEPQSQYPSSYGPLIPVEWGQGYPDNWKQNYNKYVPAYYESGNDGVEVEKYKAWTGCNATALAQLLYYYKRKPVDIGWKEVEGNIVQAFQGSFSQINNKQGSLRLKLKGIDISNQQYDYYYNGNHWFEFFDWDYSEGNQNELAAKIMYFCGLKNQSEYELIKKIVNNKLSFEGGTGSNINKDKVVLKESFDFPNAYINVRNTCNCLKWDDTLKKYISNDMPLIYRGFRENPQTHKRVGHEFIIDGYQTTTDNGVKFYHNFGWGGNNNGYYFLNDQNWYYDDQAFLSIAPVKNSDLRFSIEIEDGDPPYSFDIQFGNPSTIIPVENGTYTIRKGRITYVTNNEVVYSSPGDYHLFDKCDQGQIFIYVRVNPRENCSPDISVLNNGSKDLRDNEINNQIIYNSIIKYHYYMDAMSIFVSNLLGGAYWQDQEKGIEFWNLFQSLLDSNTGLITEEGIQQLINQSQLESISDDYIRIIAEGYNQSVMYWNEGYYTNDSLPEGYGGMIEYDTAAMRKAYEAQAYAESLGFNDVREMYDNAYEMLETEIENHQSEVCARVTVQFTQKMTMTREAFNGTLQIFNGHKSIPMQNILVDFRIKDAQGNDCTNLFQINTFSLDQITGISGEGSLAAQTNGTALVQFIPTKNAAPTEPKVYSFSGSFSFIDPFTGEGLTYPLYPVEITVNPSPDLYVDYFMQRNILGDDALTTVVVEPSVPAELGVIIHNQGAGMAKNVTLETAEPQIIDNEKGLAIDFAMYGASFNGSPRQLGLTSIPFGNIGSGQTAVGEWLFTSSLLGHFVSYEANVIHNSSYGNSDLSLVSHLDIHELIHPIYAYGNLDDSINDFLVNDNPDAYDTPDSIYFSHGGKTSVGVVDGISFDHYVSPSDTIVTLTVVPSRIGWNYGVTDDPGMNEYEIVSCIRNNDNQEIPLNNVWQTFVTIPDGGEPVYENKLHVVDTIPVQQTTTYTLVFAKKPSNLRIFHGNEDEYWSNVANWEDYILPQADDEVLIDGICELDEDAEVFSLTVAENQSLTIPDGRILTVSGTLTNSDVSGLVIEDGGQLMHGNFGAQGTVQKNILPYTNDNNGWYLIASPLAGFTSPASVVNMMSNEYDLYYFDQSHELEWINYEGDDGNYDLVPGKGYLYANSEDIVLEFPGELRSGVSTLTVPLYYEEGAEFLGFNLVGNPFVYNVSTYATNNVAEGCFRMNETKDDLIVSEISEDNPLHPAEGFFVKATDDGAYITFNPQMTNMPPKGSIRVELSENNLLIDRLIVKTHEGHSLEKFNLNETRSKVYAQGKHRECAIVPCSGNEQPINFKAAKNGQYTINVNSDGLEFNYLHLIDNLTGNDVDLLVEPSYTFEAKTSDYASRFKLVFSVCGDADNDAPFAFISNGNIVIIGAEAGSVLQIVDVMGRVLVSRGGHIQSIPTSGMAKGVYILRFVNGNNVKTQKIVVE